MAAEAYRCVQSGMLAGRNPKVNLRLCCYGIAILAVDAKLPQSHAKFDIIHAQFLKGLLQALSPCTCSFVCLLP